ncbi:hypothetical protein GMA10_12090 [Kocuria koreensis]|uniref:Uncharacterized protein n=1 Tax=Rothia koreensis TaxID=592378 RepID=A0A7M3SVX3_9MICC|nr:hypothetical protein [Rothia koreensis]MUN55938.1 hypothetical protein [Rothia koreensis]
MTTTETAAGVDFRSTGWRLTRTFMLVGVTAWLGSVSHVVGGGHIPRSGLALALSLPLIGVVFALTRFRLGFSACVPLLGAGQFAVHQLLMLGSASHGSRASILEGAPAGSSSAHHDAALHSGHASGGGTPSMPAAASPMDSPSMGDMPMGTVDMGTMDMDSMHMDSMHMHDGSLPMLVAHVVGTLLAAAVVGAVDAVLWALTVLLLPWVARLLRVALGIPESTATCPEGEQLVPRWRKPRAREPVRGPPRYLAFD